MFKVSEEEANWAVVVEPAFRPQDAYVAGFYKWRFMAYLMYLWCYFRHPDDDILVYEKEWCDEHDEQS